VSTAAAKLGTELATTKALPDITKLGSPISLPSAIGEASKLIISLVQQHEERKVAPALNTTVNILKEMFSNEKNDYDSLNETYLILAESLANVCIDKHLVDNTSVLVPALQPFSLTAHLSSTAATTTELDRAIKTQVARTRAALVDAHKKASTAMLQAITDMSTRINELATNHHMTARGTPVTLTTVEKWISTANTYLTDASTNNSSTAASTGSTTTASKPAKK